MAISKSIKTPLRGRPEAVWKLSQLLLYSFPLFRKATHSEG